jgi:hypothetical protein
MKLEKGKQKGGALFLFFYSWLYVIITVQKGVETRGKYFESFILNAGYRI